MVARLFGPLFVRMIGAASTRKLGMLKPLVGTPCYGSKLFQNYVSSIIDLKGVCGLAGIPLDFYFRGDSLITRARNDCVKYFLDGDWTHLFFIDADIGFDSADFINLLMANKPVICGNYRIKCEDVRFAGDGLGAIGDDGIASIRYAPTGFMCIERGVLEGMAYPFDTMIEAETGDYLSEDYAFCRRCERARIDVLIDTKIKLTHMGLKTYD